MADNEDLVDYDEEEVRRLVAFEGKRNEGSFQRVIIGGGSLPISVGHE
jgi:hypothetical protein